MADNELDREFAYGALVALRKAERAIVNLFNDEPYSEYDAGVQSALNALRGVYLADLISEEIKSRQERRIRLEARNGG